MWARALFALAAAASSLIGSDGSRHPVATADPQQPSGPFTASTDLVVVPVVVEDRKGASVRTLRQEDFTLTEDGKPVAIETFVAPAAAAEGGMGADGRFVVVALDNITTPAEIAWRVKDIANYFVDRMRPADDLSVITLANGRASSGGGQEAARAAIRRFGPTIYTARTRAEVVAEGLQSLESLTEQMAKSPHRRKVLAIIGASHMFNPSEPSAFYDVGPNLSVHWEGAVRNASRSNVSVYLIDPRGHAPMAEATSPTSPSSESSDGSGAGPNARQSFVYSGADTSGNFTNRTGGQAWVNTNNYKGAVESIWRDAGTYYLLGYRTPVNDHRLHDIEVKVRRDGLRLRARRARG
jgi:VWFA-related protein